MRLLKLRIEDTEKLVGREKVWDLDKILALKDLEGAFGTELRKLAAEVGQASPLTPVKVPAKKS